MLSPNPYMNVDVPGGKRGSPGPNRPGPFRPYIAITER